MTKENRCPSWNRSRLRKLGGRVKLAAEYERLARARRARIDPNTVFYEAFSGNGMLCNPEAIFRALLASDDMGRLKHVWALEDPDEFAGTMREFADDPRVRFVKYKSSAYYSALATAKYLINNATFPPQFGKREGQVYVNTWHGTPLKAMGYHVPDGALDTRNVVRNFLSADYLIAPNDDTDDMYLSAYRMRNIYRGAIVHAGTPRVDRQFATDDQNARRSGRSLRAAGVVVSDEQEIILYAPTWKGDFYAPTNDIRQLRARVEAVSSQIDTTKYRLAAEGASAGLQARDRRQGPAVDTRPERVTHQRHARRHRRADHRLLVDLHRLPGHRPARAVLHTRPRRVRVVPRLLPALRGVARSGVPRARRPRRADQATQHRQRRRPGCRLPRQVRGGPAAGTAPARTAVRPTASSTSCSVARNPSTTCSAASATDGRRS